MPDKIALNARIEILLEPAEQDPTMYEPLLIMHVPDGEPISQAVLLSGEPLSTADAGAS